jgi:hypothetical protein
METCSVSVAVFDAFLLVEQETSTMAEKNTSTNRNCMIVLINDCGK